MDVPVAHAYISVGTKIIVDYGQDDSLRGALAQAMSRRLTNISEYSVVSVQLFNRTNYLLGNNSSM